MILKLLLPGPVWPLCHPAAYLTSGCLTLQKAPRKQGEMKGFPGSFFL